MAPKRLVLVVPNDALREAVKDNWGIVNLPMWRDNKVRSLYTAASASNIMGVPSLADEDAVPSLTAVATRLLGGRLPENPEARAAAFPLFAARNDARRFPV